MKKPKSLEFQTHSKEIDYFQLNEKYFSDNGFTTTVEMLQLGENEQYIKREKHLQTLSLTDEETVVFNFQVGKGKTTIFYELIKEYYDLGYYVIVCSPFTKLVRKDNESIVDTFPSRDPITNFEKLAYKGEKIKSGISEPFIASEAIDDINVLRDRPNFETIPYDRRIHVMTINMLLGNPGEHSLDQNYYRRLYLHHLLQATEEQKVVLFMDEVHESVPNFKSKLIPNLYRWHKRVKKIYISSATYTPSSIPVIKAAAKLTGKNIKIYELPRTPNKTRANIHLHILNYPYSARSTTLKELIKVEVQNYNKLKRSVNIVTSSKALAATLAEYCFQDKVIQQEEKRTSSNDLGFVNLCTSETDVTFQEGQNNIGTTFKTGVNIKSPEGVLFIIFPSLTKERMYQHYGIFSEGVSTIIQTVGRLRRGGDLHLFVLNPEELIGEIQNYPGAIQHNKKSKEALSINSAYETVVTRYKKSLDDQINPIRLMEGNIVKKKTFTEDLHLSYKQDFAFWYPNVHEYLLKNSSQFLRNYNNPSFGRAISPYVLWCCLHDQFPNATLKKVLFYNQKLDKRLNQTNAYVTFRNIIQERQGKLARIGFRESVKDLPHYIGRHSDENQEYHSVEFKFGDALPISSAVLVNKEIGYTRTAIRALYKVCTGMDYNFEDKATYLNGCIDEANAYTASKQNDLVALYQKLGAIKQSFKTWVNAKLIVSEGNNYLPLKLHAELNPTLVQEVKDLIPKLRKQDKVLSTKAISFLQNVDTDKEETLKKSIFKELRELCFVTKGGTVQVNNEKCLVVTIKATVRDMKLL